MNKTETQVELRFDVPHSPSLNETRRQRLLSKLNNLIDPEGVLHLTAQSERRQPCNREVVTDRFQAIIAEALRVPQKRRPTRPSAASKAKRIASKKRRGQVKQLRRDAPHE